MVETCGGRGGTRSVLDNRGKLSFFVPGHCTLEMCRNIGSGQLVPTVPDLLFIRTDRRRVLSLGRQRNFLRFIVYGESKGLRCVIIPSNRVSDFVGMTSTCRRRVVFCAPSRVGVRGKAPIHVRNKGFSRIRKMFVRMGKGHGQHLII